MEASDLLLEARRRSGLTQKQLADVMGRKQSTVARWETKAQQPSFAALVQAVRACGLDLDVSVVNGDDSYVSLIRQQQRLSHGDRVEHASTPGARVAIRALHARRVQFLLAGNLAAAVHGSPVASGGAVLIVPAAKPRNRDRLDAALADMGSEVRAPQRSEFWLDQVGVLADGSHLEIAYAPPGTNGYDDLRKDARAVHAVIDAEPIALNVVSIIDLLRIADATGVPELRAGVPALRALLET